MSQPASISDLVRQYLGVRDIQSAGPRMPAGPALRGIRDVQTMAPSMPRLGGGIAGLRQFAAQVDSATPNTGNGAHWYPSDEQQPKMPPIPPIIENFQDNLLVTPPHGGIRNSLSFDLMDPYERGAGRFYQSDVLQPGMNVRPRGLR